ncbi:alpha/beta hydrolase fold domain-containing protein [Frankia gtarii]|uniref:alpha/beta hydrolase fold domain-containing protein n=1 Tax=Frankia gtarii TaxID=2950102 RepID=UPI0034D5E174
MRASPEPISQPPSQYENTTGPVLSRSYLEWFWGAYLSTPDQRADPRVSPARCDELAGLPPAVIRTYAEQGPGTGSPALRPAACGARDPSSKGLATTCTLLPGWTDGRRGSRR